MKVSLNIAQQFSNVDIKAAGVDEILRRIGAQLGAVEEVTDWSPRYDGIVVAKVVSCEKHPDADKLSVCMIDDGGRTEGVERDQNDNVQVVCGAPNVREGLTVAWLPPGATVPSTIDKDPFVLEAREIRGVVSNGMLASPAELTISDNHDGILEISEDEVGVELTKPGTAFKRLYGLDDVIIDCENKMFTHRPDCFGILGVARELAGIQGLNFQSPDWYINTNELPAASSKLSLDVKVEDTKLVPRFMAVIISDVSVAPSPIWMQAFLTRVGIKPINNIVDLTNYYSHLTGQPTHAYDYDKVSNLSGSVPTLVARQAKKREQVALLNGKTVELDAPTVVIATDKQVIGVAGVMGGSETEVDESTKNIILECANFDMYNIRRTSMKYGLFTDAVTRFTKGQSVLQNDRVLAKIMSDIGEQCGGIATSDVFDIYAGLPKLQNVNVSCKFINERLGSNLNSTEVQNLLSNVEITVSAVNDELVIESPFWRTDIELPEDVVEEVGRLYGFDKLPVLLPKRTLTPVRRNELLEVKSRIREVLAAAGANEVLTYTFVHGDLMKKVGQDKEIAYKLGNALSPELQYYRLSLLPSLLDKVHANVKSGHDEFAMFEINKVHAKGFIGEDQLPKEDQRLAFVFVADERVAATHYNGAAYYQARKYLTYLLASLGLTPRFELATDYQPKIDISKAAFAPFEPKRSAIIRDKDGEFIGEIGEFRSNVQKKLKLPQFVAGFELDVLQLLKLTKATNYVALSKFPSTDQDISLQVDLDVTYTDLFANLWQSLIEAEERHGYIARLELIDSYSSPGAANKNMTFRVTLSHGQRTLVKEEVGVLMNEIATSANVIFGAVRL